MSLSDKIDFFPIEHTTYQKTLPQLSKTVPSNFGWHADKYLPLINRLRFVIVHRDLVHMEGTAHIDFPKFETAEAINFKILPVMHMQKL